MTRISSTLRYWMNTVVEPYAHVVGDLRRQRARWFAQMMLGALVASVTLFCGLFPVLYLLQDPELPRSVFRGATPILGAAIGLFIAKHGSDRVIGAWTVSVVLLTSVVSVFLSQNESGIFGLSIGIIAVIFAFAFFSHRTGIAVAMVHGIIILLYGLLTPTTDLSNLISSVFGFHVLTSAFIGMVIWLYRQMVTAQERRVEDVEELFRQTVNYFNEPFGIFDSQLRCTFVNHVAVERYGLTPEVLVGHTLKEVLPADQYRYYEPMLRRVLDERVPLKEEVTFTFAARERTVILNGVPLLNEQGGVKRILVYLFDITEIRESQRRGELNEMRVRFVSMASHDLRTPLASIRLNTELMQRYRTKMADSKIDNTLGLIIHQVDSMTHMVDDVLLYTRIESGHFELKLERLELAEWVTLLLHELRPIHHTHPLCLTIEGIPQAIRADRQLLRRVLVNLITNAVKYSEPGRSVDVVLNFKAAEVVMSVSDQGIGIPESNLPNLFEPFRRGDNVGTRRGTGLGLAIVKQGVELHGGVVEVESTADVGSRFTLTLPMVLMA